MTNIRKYVGLNSVKNVFLNTCKNSCICINRCEYSTDKPPPIENPFLRTIRIFRNEAKTVKDNIGSFFSRLKSELEKERLEKERKADPNRRYRDRVFPEHCDVAIIGGGPLASSIAYWLKQRTPNAITVTVIEKEPAENQNHLIWGKYGEASTALSVTGLRQQFTLEENIRMSLFCAHFLRNYHKYLHVEGHDLPDIKFTPFGSLYLASEEEAIFMEENAIIQRKLGVRNELLTPGKLKEKFPWINTEGVALGCHGLENEGWFDSWSLLYAFKRKALSLGVEYVDGETIGFEFRKMPDILMEGIDPGSYETVDKVVVKLENEEVKAIKFGIVIIAAGPFSAKVARMAKIGNGKGLLRVPLPIEPRKRYVYNMSCSEGPGLNTPLTIDNSGVYFRREGLAGNYVCGRSPNPENEPDVDNLEVDYEYFDKHVLPTLASRVPAFKSAKITDAWSGYSEYNTYDENGIVGPHPYYMNMYIAAGFSGQGIQDIPAVGRSVMEMILDGRFESIDLTRMSMDRIISDFPLTERIVI